METDMQHRHDISDEAWALIEPILPGQRGQWGCKLTRKMQKLEKSRNWLEIGTFKLEK